MRARPSSQAGVTLEAGLHREPDHRADHRDAQKTGEEKEEGFHFWIPFWGGVWYVAGMARWTDKTIAPNRRSEAGWSRQVRSYVQGSGVKDLRTGVTGDFDRTLDGDLDSFMRAALAFKEPDDAATSD